MPAQKSSPTSLQSIDLASERLIQAKGVLGLLTADADAPTFTASMSDVMSALWAVEALIDQAHTAVKACRN
jgi:hypothetical protein